MGITVTAVPAYDGKQGNDAYTQMQHSLKFLLPLLQTSIKLTCISQLLPIEISEVISYDILTVVFLKEPQCIYNRRLFCIISLLQPLIFLSVTLC